MVNKKAGIAIAIIAIAINISACSSNKTFEPSTTKKAKPIRVEVESLKRDKVVLKTPKKSASALNTADVVLESKKSGVVYEKRTPKKVYAKSIEYRKPKYNNRHYLRSQPPLPHIRVARLTGDYANNYQTKTFINMMVSKHGFDKRHLNHIFSNTVSTPFLRKMAYSDAHPNKKLNKKRRSGRWNRYRGNFLTNRTINKGVQFWRKNRVDLKRAEQQFGVPEEYILGIIGVETRYGGNVGKNRAIDALSAMGFNNARRGKYFRSELESYLLMTRSARLDPLKPMSSYAGALGLSQFMPSNIKRYAVDHDRSGTVNLWTPADAIGSVANYFKKHGWRKGGTVAVPAYSSSRKYRSLRTGFKSSHSLTRLKSSGVSANYLGNITGKASLIKLNTYSGDELWLGGHNFYVITRYNHSSYYAMAVHQLAQEIKKRISGRSVIRQASLN